MKVCTIELLSFSPSFLEKNISGEMFLKGQVHGPFG